MEKTPVLEATPLVRARLRKSLRAPDGGAFTLDVDLAVAAGEVLALTGPSGSGKTTLLRLLAGLERPDEGEIYFGDQCWVDVGRRRWQPPQQRSVGLVFQDYALFPHLTVRQNLRFALSRTAPASLADELTEMLALSELEGRYPHQLSGGQQQRVALARALAPQPRLLLLDEPLTALDDPLRLKLQSYLLTLHHRFDLTVVIVTHDWREIGRLAGRTALMKHGRIDRLEATPQLREPGNGPLSLRAEVVHHSPEGDLIIALGNNLLRLPARLVGTKTYHVGDRVQLTAEQLRLAGEDVN